MSPPDDTYGTGKRLRFVAAVIEERRPRTILDLGCGTGLQLTTPLAQAFPEVEITGADEDARTIAWAEAHRAAENLRFRLADEVADGARFDLVIASEVIEHVETPDRFLVSLKHRLNPEGRLIVTVPNGYGPFEMSTLVEAGLRATRLYALLRLVKRRLSRPAPAPTAEGVAADTLAHSPHVNFFSYAEIRRLFRDCGLETERYLGRTFLCGFGFDQMLKPGPLRRWNAAIADRLPARMVSDWMFVLRPTPEVARAAPYRRNGYARFRRRLSAGGGDGDMPPRVNP